MDQRIKERLKDMFAVPRGEAQAWVAVIVVILGLAAWVTYEQAFTGPDPGKYASERKVLGTWLGEKETPDTSERRAIQFFNFDPNGLPVEDWIKLGLTEKQAQAIHRYEERGGEFRSKADLARMRVVRPELFAQWRPFIQLPDSALRSAPREASFPKYGDRKGDTAVTRSWEPRGSFEHRPVEVNTCDSAQLIALPGIGPSFARGILKYRDQLGGYFSLDQLSEVFVLQDKPDAIARIKGLLEVDTLMMRRIPINTCTVEELAAHPYLRWKLARPLFAYRQQHGPFKSVEAIKGCAVITEEVYQRIAPYLTTE